MRMPEYQLAGSFCISGSKTIVQIQSQKVKSEKGFMNETKAT